MMDLSVALSNCSSNWTVSVSLYIVSDASIARYVRDFANI